MAHTELLPATKGRDVSAAFAVHMRESSRIRMQQYMADTFRTMIPMQHISDKQAEEVTQLQSYVSELQTLSLQEQQSINLSKAANSNTARVWKQKEYAIQTNIDNVMEKISSLGIVNTKTIRSRVNGLVPMEGKSQQERALSAVLLLLSGANNGYALTRSLVAYTTRHEVFTTISPTAWGEIAEKVEQTISRLNPSLGESLMHQLPPWMRMIIYGKRLKIHKEDPQYYAQLAEQAEDIATLDVYARSLRRQANKDASVAECCAILDGIASLSCLHTESGAFRLTGQDAQDLYPITRRVQFILVALRAVGIDGADMVLHYIRSLQLSSRKEYGVLINSIGQAIDQIAYEPIRMHSRSVYDSTVRTVSRRSSKRAKEYTHRRIALLESARKTIQSLGREGQNPEKMVIYQ